VFLEAAKSLQVAFASPKTATQSPETERKHLRIGEGEGMSRDKKITSHYWAHLESHLA
jgi:hypothetical protein